LWAAPTLPRPAAAAAAGAMCSSPSLSQPLTLPPSPS
jgi:hypothetical protein